MKLNYGISKPQTPYIVLNMHLMSLLQCIQISNISIFTFLPILRTSFSPHRNSPQPMNFSDVISIRKSVDAFDSRTHELKTRCRGIVETASNTQKQRLRHGT